MMRKLAEFRELMQKALDEENDELLRHAARGFLRTWSLLFPS